MSSRFQVAIRAARAAGRMLVEKLEHGRTVKSKGKRDIVTDADYAAERIVRETLLGSFPRDNFLSEEGSVAEQKRLWAQASRSNGIAMWIVDPLDGTTNYSRGLYPFCVSIAMYQAGVVQIGVVYDPVTDELFAAERGRGAFLNNKPIRVSNNHKIEDAVLAVEWARAPRLRRRTTEIFGRVVDRAMTGRAFGSAALGISYIAAGRFDGYMHLSLSPWDVAAAGLIIEEAGGTMTTPTGAPWDVHSQAYVASNGFLHARLLRFFK